MSVLDEEVADGEALDEGLGDAPVVALGEEVADALLVCPPFACGDPPVQPATASAHTSSAAGSGWRGRMGSPGWTVR
jgi:hypothetical protein